MSQDDRVRRLERYHDRLKAVISRNDAAVGDAVTGRLTELANHDSAFPKALMDRIMEIRDSTDDGDPPNGSSGKAHSS